MLLRANEETNLVFIDAPTGFRNIKCALDPLFAGSTRHGAYYLDCDRGSLAANSDTPRQQQAEKERDVFHALGERSGKFRQAYSPWNN